LLAKIKSFLIRFEGDSVEPGKERLIKIIVYKHISKKPSKMA